jgi:hypothetical protein
MKNSAKERCWDWMVFPFKAYIIAVPIAVLFCQFFENFPQSYKTNMQNASYWDARLEKSMMKEASTKIFCRVEVGYGVCAAILVLDATIANFTHNKKRFRAALVFALLAVISVIVFLPFALDAP